MSTALILNDLVYLLNLEHMLKKNYVAKFIFDF